MIDVVKARALWQELHSHKSYCRVTHKLFLKNWLPRVRETLGCESCFRKLQFFMDKWPPEYGEGFYLWGVCLHDFVNRQLGRNLFFPALTIEPLTLRGIFQ